MSRSITGRQSQPNECQLLGVGYSATSIYRKSSVVVHDHFGNAHVVLETRWGLGLSSDDLPEENIVRYSLIQYTGGTQI